MVGEIAATSSLMYCFKSAVALGFFFDVLFQIRRCPWFLFVHPALEISSEEEVLRPRTLVPMNIEVPTKYPLS